MGVRRLELPWLRNQDQAPGSYRVCNNDLPFELEASSLASISPSDLFQEAAFAFRGYNITNLGRSRELLEHPAYGPIVQPYLRDASAICADVVDRRVDLADRVRRNEETSLETYHEAIALTVAMELAQIGILRERFGFDYSRAKLAYGYSLGEIAALSASGFFDMEQALKVPLAMSSDAAELAHDTTLAVLFSRGPALDLTKVDRLCQDLNAEGQGVIGISAYLAPNTAILVGQGSTVDRFAGQLRLRFPERVYLRKNEHRWPPMHTPIVWERNISNRAAVLMHQMQFARPAPIPAVFSLVTGNISYDELNCRRILTEWIDRPQRLWDAIYETLVLGIHTVIHVGPEPNLIPATFQRLADNVQGQMAIRSFGGMGLRAVSQVVRRPWLSRLLPERSALLRAPFVQQVVLEDWLLAHSPL